MQNLFGDMGNIAWADNNKPEDTAMIRGVTLR